MNMKKSIAGVMASIVAVSAMATLMVSAKNEIVYTKDQPAYTNTWDFTGKSYKVLWSGVASSTYGNVSTTPATVAKSEGTLTLANATIKITAANTAAAITVANTASVAPGATAATFAGSTLSLDVVDAGTTTAAALATEINKLTGFNATVTYNLGATETTTFVTDAAVTALTTLAFTAGTPGATTGGVLADNAATEMRIKFYKEDTKTNLVTVDTAKMKVTGYVLDNLSKSTLTTKEFPLVWDKDGKYWSIKQVAGTTVTSDGKIDLTAFNGGIIGYDLAYTISDTSKTSEADAKSLASGTSYKAWADVQFVGTINTALAPFRNSFDHSTNPNASSIDTGIGKLDTNDTTHGFTITGFDTAATRTTDSAETYLGSVKSGEVVYDLASNIRSAYSKEMTNSTWTNASKTYAGKTYDSISDATKALVAGQTDAANGKISNSDFGLENFRLAIQNAIGDAKGATLTFSVYSTSTAGEKTASKIDGGNTATLLTTADAQDFAVAINAKNSKNYTKAAKVVDNKLIINWDDVTQGLAAGTISDMYFRVAAGKSFTIDSIKLDVPAKSFVELSAGAGVADSAAAITTAATTAAVVAAPVVTAAATNPTTGNAPIALAVIPVAIIAAAIIAKKRG